MLTNGLMNGASAPGAPPAGSGEDPARGDSEEAVVGSAATTQAAESSRHRPSSIDARSGRASQARTWGGPGGHGAHETGRGERTVPEAGALVPSRPVR